MSISNGRANRTQQRRKLRRSISQQVYTGLQKASSVATALSPEVASVLQSLGVDYVDLIQCHDVEFGVLDQVASETIPALRALQDAGLVIGVGITGYPQVR